VPGVLDGVDEVILTIDTYEEVAQHLGGSDATDVTGGMAGKVQALLGLDALAHVFDPAGLSAFLDGESPGTLVGAHH
jgi:isopentenyl phosphate kinase